MAFVLGDNFNLPIKVMTGEYEVFPAVVSKIQFIISSLRINDTYKIEKYFITGDESSVVTYDENEGVFLFPFSTAESSHFGGGFQVQARCYFGDGITLGSQVYTQTQYASLSAISLQPTTDNLIGGVVDSNGNYLGCAPYTVTVNIPASRRVPYGVYIRYSANADGTNFTITPQSDTKYVGFAVGNEAPTEKEDYMWTQIAIKPETILVSIIESSSTPTVETTYNSLLKKIDFQNENVSVGDLFCGLWNKNNVLYAVKCEVTRVDNTEYIGLKVKQVLNLGNPTQMTSDISTIQTDSQNNIRNIQWVESGNAYSITYTRKDGSTATVSVPLTAIKNELNSLDGRLDTAESYIGTLQSDVSGLESEVATKQNKTDNSLQTTNKNIVSAINEVREIAIGAEKPVGYTNYQTMITAVNSLSASAYEVGQSIYIGTVDVPDVWVLAIEQTSVPYTYTTDEAIVNALKNNGSIQVGYYRLSQLETGKVTTDHSELSNLDYEHAGHTGFQPTLVSGANIKTINNQSILGSGNIDIQGGGTGDYDDLENKPIVNADLDTTTPVAGTYYRHTGESTGPTQFVVGDDLRAVYWDTRKSIEEMSSILYVGDLMTMANSDGSERIFVEDDSTYGICIRATSFGIRIFDSVNGWNTSSISSFNSLLRINDFSITSVEDNDFMSSTPIVTNYTTGEIYKYKDGAYKPLDKDVSWGSIGGTLTDQQDLVQALNGKVSDVTIGGTSIVSSGVADIPYASTSNAGLIRASASYGTQVSGAFLQGRTRTYEQYNTDSGTLFVCKGTLDNVIEGKNLGENIDIVVDM